MSFKEKYPSFIENIMINRDPMIFSQNRFYMFEGMMASTTVAIAVLCPD